MKKDIKIAVVATMSSGKSTLINALLGQELLPSKNEACTAKISKIANNNMLKEFQCECLDKNRNVIYKEKSVSYEDLEKYNEDEKVVYLNIEGPMDYIFEGESRLILIDTPGPNNSRDIRHGEITDKILNDKDFEKIIYVMNATQFGINDDSNFLRKISHLMIKENEKLKDKFLFVVNKCDELDIEKEETIDKLLEMVKKYLLNFEIKNPNIIFTSAQMAKLIRIDKLGKKLSRKEKAFLKSYEDFIEIEGFHFEKFATVDENIKEKIKDKLKKAKIDKDECEEVLIHTGIPVLEAYINEYLREEENKEQVDKTIPEVYIRYNPYTLKIEIKINGEEISKESSIYAKCQNNRLQYLIEKSLNWDGLLVELKKYLNEEMFKLTFNGRRMDFEDLLYSTGNDRCITLNFEEKEDDEYILGMLCKIVNILQGELLKNTEEEIKNTEFRVNVIATMSSGKSTLINSMIGKDLLPSKNEACTAKISKIKNNNSIKEFKCECKDEEGKIIYKEKEVSLKDLKKYNEDEKVSILNIEGPMKEILNQKMKLVLFDTPGPNNARNEQHKAVTNGIIEDKEKSVVIYVINATQAGINDDANLLLQISNEMNRGGKQSRDRFLFVINKCDELDVEKGETIDKLLDNVRKDLSKYEIEEPNLFPLSAEMAKLIRMDKDGEKLSRKEKSFLNLYRDFIELEGLHFEKFATLSPSVRRKIEERLQKAKENDDVYEEALIHTGVPAIEETLNEYLEKYAFPIKIKETTDIFADCIKELNMLNKLKERINSSKEEKEKITKQIEDARNKIENKELVEEFKVRVSKLGIDLLKFEELKKIYTRKCKKILAELSKKIIYDQEGKENTKIDITEAIVYLKELENELREIEKSLETKLNIEFKNTVEDEGEKIFEEYNKYVEKLKAEININGFEITGIRAINSLITKSMEQEIEERKEKEDIIKIKSYRKPFRLFKPRTWAIFGGEYEYNKEKIGEREVIDIKKFIRDEETIVVRNVERAIDSKATEVKKKQEEQKIYYLSKIALLDKEIDITFDKINKLLEKEENLNLNLKEIEYKKNWIDNMSFSIDRIMDI